MNQNPKTVQLKPDDLYLIGAGGHAKVVVSTFQAAGVEVFALLDDDRKKAGRQVAGVPVVYGLDMLENLAFRVRGLIAVGDNRLRRHLSQRFTQVDWQTAVHPQAYVHPSAQIGIGTVVFAGAVIQPDAVIGKHCIINTGATVDHDCQIGDYAHVAPGCHLAGGVVLGDGVLMGISSAVIPGVKVGAWATVGAGGVVVDNLPPEVLALGVPARVIEQS
jgi:sugar O-acyltransferase (sialic acid O-acetyltransferase NeuD family)